MAEENKIVIVNKHYDDANRVSKKSFNKDSVYCKGEIIVSNDPENPGIFILDKNGAVVEIKNQRLLSELADDLGITEVLSSYTETLGAIQSNASAITAIEQSMPSRLSDLEDDLDLDRRFEEAGKVQSVNGQTGDVVIDVASNEVVSGLVSDVQQIKEQGLTNEAYSGLVSSVSTNLMTSLDDYIKEKVAESVAKQTVGGIIPCTAEQYEAWLAADLIKNDNFYYIYEEETGSVIDIVINGDVLDFGNIEAPVDGVLELPGYVDENGVLIIDSSYVVPSTPGDDEPIASGSTSGSSEEVSSGTTGGDVTEEDTDTDDILEISTQSEYDIETKTLSINGVVDEEGTLTIEL